MNREILAKLHLQLAERPRNVQALLPSTPRASTHRIEAKADSAPVVWIYDAIGEGGVDAAELVPALAELDASEIQVRVNSPGGCFFSGVAIANALARHPAKVDIHVDGLAASAASVIMMAGDHVTMHPGSQAMIHNALTLTVGDAAAHRKTADLLAAASADIAALYASRSGKPAEEWQALMDAETWFRADEAVTAGLAHEAPVPDTAPDPNRSWVAVLQAFHAAVSRETEPICPEHAPFRTSDCATRPHNTHTSSAPAEVVTPDASSPAPVNLSELFSSAFREATL